MAQGGVSEQRADGGQAGVTGADAIVPLVFQVIEEGADDRGVEVIDVQLRWLLVFLPETKTSSSRRVSR